MDIDIEDEPDADKCLVLKHGRSLEAVIDGLILDPALRLLKKQVPCKHHYEVNAA